MRMTVLRLMLHLSVGLPVALVTPGLQLPLAGQAGPSARAAAVDSILVASLGDSGAGCAAAVVHGALHPYRTAIGYASMEYSIPIGFETVFNVASLSKQFTAMAVLMLARDRALSLEDDIREHLPDFPFYGDTIRVRHLMHHSSGLRDYLGLLDLGGRRISDYWSNTDVIELLRRQRGTHFAPGDRFMYSNSGYVLLAEIVAHVTGSSLAEYADEAIFDPLGMDHTGFVSDPGTVTSNLASGYQKDSVGMPKRAISLLSTIGDGGVRTTLDDLLRWHRYLADGLARDDPIVSRLLTPGTFNDGSPGKYAGGLRREVLRDVVFFEHTGSTSGWNAHYSWSPQAEFAVLLLCNSATARPIAIADAIANVYLHDNSTESGPAQVADAIEEVEEPRGHPALLPISALKRLVGQYRYRSNNLEFALTHDSLRVRVNFASRVDDLRPVGAREFEFVGRDWRLEFGPDLEGRVAQVALMIEGRPEPLVFQRIDPMPVDAMDVFEGDYYSDELDASYRVRLSGNDLMVEIVDSRTGAAVQMLREAATDLWVASGDEFRFRRGEAGEVVGMVLDAVGGAEGITFERSRRLPP